MSTKLFRFVAALLLVVSAVANTGVAWGGAGAQNLKLSPGTGLQSLNTPLAMPQWAQFDDVAPANPAGPWITIDNPLTNGNPNAMVFVTPDWNPGGVGGIYDDHPVGVYYIGTHPIWAILNLDRAGIPGYAAFNVLVTNPATNVFFQVATSANTIGNLTMIDNPLTNGNPNAIVFVTPDWTPGGVTGIVSELDKHPIGVFYTGSQWAIFNQDGAAIPDNAGFNVFVPPVGAGVFVHKATAGNSYGDYTRIDNHLANGNPNAIVFVTPNYNPGDVGGTNDDHNIGVWYTGSHWAIFNQDGVAMPVNAAFNVYVYGNFKIFLPVVTR